MGLLRWGGPCYIAAVPRAALVVVGLLASSLAAWAALADAARPLALESPALVRIAAGSFVMGSTDADVAFALALCRQEGGAEGGCREDVFADEAPTRRVYLHAYRIDRLEVSHADWWRCVRAGACPPARVASADTRLGRPDHPVVGVTWREASAYCRWAGGRLPSEAEWERAARGGSARRFPWGHAFNTRLANHGSPSGEPDAADGYLYAAPVDGFGDGHSAHGLSNMAGNVWELVADRYDAHAYASGDAVDPRGAVEGDKRVVRGGSWRSPAYALRVTQRAAVGEDESRPDVGVRCAYDAR